MNLNLTNHTAVVCGSSQGLGLAAAKEIALLGARVILFSRNEESLRSALGFLDRSSNQQHGYLVADFNEPEQVRSAIHNFLQEGNRAQILVNNTGGPPSGKAIEAAMVDFTSAFNAHLICNHILVQALVPGMKEAGYGRIINIISTSVKSPLPNLGVSNTIRGAVANWAKTLASELGPLGITVNNVLPGFTKTSRADYIIHKKASDTDATFEDTLSSLVKEIPAGRIGQPEELGAAVAFLCSPSAGYINGVNLPVDGGRLGCL